MKTSRFPTFLLTVTLTACTAQVQESPHPAKTVALTLREARATYANPAFCKKKQECDPDAFAQHPVP